MHISNKVKHSLFYQIGVLLFSKRKEEYRDVLYDYVNTDNVVWFSELGEKNDDRRFLYISVGEKDDHSDASTTGFFALLMKYGLQRLDFADKYNLEPYIFWGPDTPYAEDISIYEKTNVFEYYFENITKQTKEEILSSKFVCKSCASHVLSLTGRYRDSIYEQEEDELIRYAYLYRKYIKLNYQTQKYINENVNWILKEKKTLGVHYRGIEWSNLKGHPIPPSLDEYFDIISKCLEEDRYEQIFLATESEDTVMAFKEKFGEKVVLYTDVARTKSGSTQLVIFNDNQKSIQYKRYNMGLEVLRDAYTLVACRGFIGGISQVSYAVRYIKRSIGEKFLTETILDHGIRRDSGISIKKYAMQQKK